MINLNNNSNIKIEDSPKISKITLDGYDRYRRKSYQKHGSGRTYLYQLPIDTNISIRKHVDYLYISSDLIRTEQDFNIKYEDSYYRAGIGNLKMIKSSNLIECNLNAHPIDHFYVK